MRLIARFRCNTKGPNSSRTIYRLAYIRFSSDLIMSESANNFITIITFGMPHEIIPVRARLESDGIECFVRDELTVTAQPLWSNAIGGIKLQVRERDFVRARDILIECGYLQKEPEVILTSSNGFAHLSSRIPFVKTFPVEVRWIVALISVIVILIIPVFLYLCFN